MSERILWIFFFFWTTYADFAKDHLISQISLFKILLLFNSLQKNRPLHLFESLFSLRFCDAILLCLSVCYTHIPPAWHLSSLIEPWFCPGIQLSSIQQLALGGKTHCPRLEEKLSFSFLLDIHVLLQSCHKHEGNQV